MAARLAPVRIQGIGLIACLAAGACAGGTAGARGSNGSAASVGHQIRSDPYLVLLRGDAARSLALLDEESTEAGETDINSDRASVRLGALCELGRTDDARTYVEQLLEDWKAELARTPEGADAAAMQHVFHVAPELTHTPGAKACADEYTQMYNARSREIAASLEEGEPAQGALVSTTAPP